MNGKSTALVTGASTGIGRGIALTLAAKGYDLFISHLNEPEAAAEVAERIRSEHGRRCGVMQIDLSKPDAPKKLFDEALAYLGEIRLLVNNAGLTITGDITEMPEEKIDYLYHLNYRTPLVLTKHVTRQMIEKGIRGAVVSTASSRAERAYPTDAVYGGLKAALVRSTQSMALDLAPHGIRVNCVAPGAIMVRDYNAFYENLDRKIPLGRVGTPQDIGNAVAWLASDEASYVTGITLRVDGGLILPGMPERPNLGPNEPWGKPL